MGTIRIYTQIIDGDSTFDLNKLTYYDSLCHFEQYAETSDRLFWGGKWTHTRENPLIYLCFTTQVSSAFSLCK